VKRLTHPSLLAVLLLGLAPGGGALAQQAPTPVPLVAPPGPVSRFPTRFDIIDAPEQFARVLLIVDFPGGAWTPPHAPGGYVYVSVIEGEISTRIFGMPGQGETYPAGSAFTASPGEYLELGNATSANSRVVATALLPKGAPLTIDTDGFSSDVYSGPTDGYRVLDSERRAPRPMLVHHSSIEVERPAGALQLVHLVLDFDPGVWTPRHLHGGQELVTLTAGDLTLQRRGETQIFTAGESWLNESGLVHAAGNEGTSLAQAVASFLLPAGRPLTTVV
jgi:quercetin dioxygenase-like cupin family protein